MAIKRITTVNKFASGAAFIFINKRKDPKSQFTINYSSGGFGGGGGAAGEGPNMEGGSSGDAGGGGGTDLTDGLSDMNLQ